MNCLYLPSSLDWCEYNYIYNNYIAEFWNTITGIFLCISSIILLRKQKNKKLYFSNILLFIVGIGTILFHATLLYIFQLLDEIPMILIAIEYLKITYYLNKLNDNFIIYYYHSILYIFLSYFVNLHQLMFKTILISVIVLIIFKLYNYNKSLNIKIFNKIYKKKNQNILCNLSNKNDVFFIFHEKYDDSEIYKIYINKRKVLKKNIRINIVIFSTSIIIWNIDNLYCNEINQKIQLHAIWHILTSIGMFYLNEMFTIYLELNMLLN